MGLNFMARACRMVNYDATANLAGRGGGKSSVPRRGAFEGHPKVAVGVSFVLPRCFE